MDKFRRVRKTSPQQSQPATSSSAAGTLASTSSTKFTIEQKVTTGAIKKGPYSVKRSVDPNDVVIKRRLGEGSKPLFSRVDICVNRSASPKKQPTTRASSSDSSSSEDHYRHRTNSSKSESGKGKRKSPEKVPYFIDQKREKDRIKRVYGQSRSSRSLSRERRRRIGNGRSRSRTPPSYQRRHRSYGERRSPSRDRYRSRYRSRSRSRSRERRRISRSHRYGSMDERQPPPPPATQFIPIPVPVEYPYMQPAWGAPMLPPQPRFPFLMRPMRPPPIPYMPRNFRPPRYAQRGNFRPRQY